MTSTDGGGHTGRLTVALLQTPGNPEGISANILELSRAVAAAKRAGADLLLTPELFLTGYDIAERYDSLPLEDALAQCRRLASESSLALVVCMPELDLASRSVFNTAYFIGRDGDIVGKHRKSQLFGEGERAAFVEGERAFTLVEFEGVQIAMMICYEVEFPEAVRAAALAGAHLIAVPTAQMEPFGFVAEQMIRVRAWENQVYVAYANHCGIERSTRYVGRSSIVDPSGTVAASLRDRRGLIQAVVDRELVTGGQELNPYLVDLRRELYPVSASCE